MGLVVGFILGFVANALIVVLYEQMSRPSLEITIDPNGRVRGSSPSLPAHEFHHLVIRNKAAWWPLPSRKPAWSTKARLEIFAADGTSIEREPIYVRWTSRPEPLLPGVGPSGLVNLVDPAKLVGGRNVDVHSHEDQQASLFVKFEGEDACYAFSNESYLYERWQNPAWKIPRGTFRIRVTVYYERRLQREFQLVNNGPALADVQLTMPDAHTE